MKSPYLSAAAWFALTGIVPGLLWIGPAFLDLRPIPTEAIWHFILLPCIAAAISGALLGHAILNLDWVKTNWGAFLCGASVGIVSVVFYAPMLATYSSATRPAGGPAADTFAGVLSMTLYLGLLFAGWAFAIIGGISGLLLHKVAQQGAAVDATNAGSRH